MSTFTTEELFGSPFNFQSDDDARNYIVEASRKRGIPAEDSLATWRGEFRPGGWQSTNNRGGYREPSYGDFQLLVGGPGTGFPTGMGNDFIAKTGLDPTDKRNRKAMIDFALDHAQEKGWGAWYGAPPALRSRGGYAKAQYIAPPDEAQTFSTEELFAQTEAPQRSWSDTISRGVENFFDPNSPENREAAKALKEQPMFPSPSVLLEPFKLPVGAAEEYFNLPQISNERDLARETIDRFKGYTTEEGAKEAIAERPGGTLVDVLSVALGARGLTKAKASSTKTKTSTPVPNPTLEAGTRAGVEVPNVLERHPAVQNAAAKAAQLPFVGTPLEESAGRAVTQLGDAKGRARQALGSGDVERAGELARKDLDAYAGESNPAIKNAYTQLDQQINPAITAPLTNTLKELNAINAQRQAAGLPPTGDFLGEAVTRPGGLNYEGTKFLRTNLGQQIKEHKLPADIPTATVERLYGALSKDLENVVGVAGGPQAVKTFQYANRLNALVAERRKRAARILGAKNDEGIVDRLLATASTSSRADIKTLSVARGAMDKASWRELSSALVERLGKDKAGEFSPERFITAYNKLSKQGKAILFDKPTMQALDDIATLSTKFNNINRYTNTSKTAAGAFSYSAPFAVFADPITALSTILGGRMLSHLLSRPATVKYVHQWTRAYTSQNKKAMASAARNLAGAIAAETNRPDLEDRISKELQNGLQRSG